MLKFLVTFLLSQMLLYKSPMNLLIIIIFMCVNLSMISFLMSMNYWLMFLIILIYISGIMVLFMFIVSLSPNEKSLVKKSKSLVWILTLNMLMLMTMKIMVKKEFKMNSSYKTNIIFLMMMLTLIIFSAYIPPKIMMLFKGLKSSK